MTLSVSRQTINKQRQRVKNQKTIKLPQNQSDLETTFSKLYYDPASTGAYGGIERLTQAAHKELRGVQSLKSIRNKVKSWLKSQDTYTLHYPIKRRFKRNAIIVYGIDDQWQADLVDMQSWRKENSGYNHLLTCIDVFSKYAWVRPLKSKLGSEVAGAFADIFLKSKRLPCSMQTDKGKEFFNSSVKKLFTDHDIRHFTTENETKAAVVERFNRTLKSKMWRYFTEMGNHKYVDILQKLVSAYNASVHRSIGTAPDAVTYKTEKSVWQRMYGTLKENSENDFKFSIGTQVRISKFKWHFDKGYLPNWTDEIFVVIKQYKSRPRRLYKLNDISGETVNGLFYEDELQEVQKDVESGEFEVERVLEKRKNTVTGATEVLVKWKGWPDKFNIWLPEREVKNALR